MTALYAIVLVLGIAALLLWIAASAVAITVDGWSRFDPEERFGAAGRIGTAVLTGFGLAGMSATFAGWETLVALIAALGGAALAGGAARLLGPR